MNTNLEQSKILMQFLPLESADMHYNNVSIKGINYVDEYRAELMDYNTAQKVLSKYLVNPLFEVIPCWSLAALRLLLPSAIEFNDKTYLFDSYKTSDGIWVYQYAAFDESTLFYFKSTHDVDACYEMIICLHEQKFL